MIRTELTPPAELATISSVQRELRKLSRSGALPVAMLPLIALGGCVQVTAPDKPIVIELNVNIRQEVIYRLAEDAGNTIEQNKDIF